MILKLRKAIVRYISQMRWHTVVLALFIYGISSWWLLYLAGEDALTNPVDFIYWMVVTASTVGYGDFSPITATGKVIIGFYVIPVGLSIFAFVLGRAAAWVSEQWHKRARGFMSVHLDNHILLLGWNGERTMHLLRLLLREREILGEHQPIVLCVKVDMDNPLPDQIEFVKVNSFNKDEDMDKASIDSASVIIVDNPEDDLTMTTSLYASHRNPDSHILAYFKDESLVKLLTEHCPNVECMPSVAVEMLAKSAFDPGSSQLHFDLLSVNEGQAQFSVSVPSGISPLSTDVVFTRLKKNYKATLIGFASSDAPKSIVLNPDLDTQIKGGDKLFYIADKRINDFNWDDLHV